MRRSTKSFSFLLEFILVLLFFSISSAICVHVQVQASAMNQKANDTKVAIQLIQNYMSHRENMPLSYDQEGQPSKEGYYQIIEKKDKEIIEISVIANNEVLISLPYYGGDTR